MTRQIKIWADLLSDARCIMELWRASNRPTIIGMTESFDPDVGAFVAVEFEDATVLSPEAGGLIGDGDFYPTREKIMRNNPAR